MSSFYVLAFDVGGTEIKAAAIRLGEIVKETISSYESRSTGTADEIVAHIVRIAVDLTTAIDTGMHDIGGAGFAFPGPFDYASGISYIQGLGKYESLYGLNVASLLEHAFRSNDTLRRCLSPEFRLAFENDATMFGLGEAAYGAAIGSRKAVCFTIGTGLGSCFLNGGMPIVAGDGVPSRGWIYNLPYGDGIADDYVSKRGMLRLAEQLGVAVDERGIRGLSIRAYAGELEAVRLFEAFGRRMADVLAGALLAFRPDTVVLGGQISKSGNLFVPAFMDGLRQSGLQPRVCLSSDTQTSVFKGIYDFVVPTLQDRESAGPL